ncbi:hypothetical protein LEMLEM_LOCUS7448, partial [Lemmus lemmus]
MLEGSKRQNRHVSAGLQRQPPIENAQHPPAGRHRISLPPSSQGLEEGAELQRLPRFMLLQSFEARFPQK